MQACTNKDHLVQKKICLPDLTLTRKNFVSHEEVFTAPSTEERAAIGSPESSFRQHQHFSLKKFLYCVLRSAPWMFLLMYTVFFIILSIFYGFN